MVTSWFQELAIVWMAASILLSLTLQETPMSSRTTVGSTGGNAKQGTDSDHPNHNLERLRSELESSSKEIDLERQA